MSQAITRVFARRGQRKRTSITISLSLTSEKDARRVAKALDRIKADAAYNGRTFSQTLAQMIVQEARDG